MSSTDALNHQMIDDVDGSVLDYINTGGDFFVGERDVMKLTKWSRTTLYRRVKNQAFPKPVDDSPKAWLASQVKKYFEDIQKNHASAA